MVRGDAVGESAALALLARLALQQNEIEEATRRATEAVELADKGDSAEARTRARLALGHARLAEREN